MMDYLNIFLPQTKRLVRALSSTAAIIMSTPTHCGSATWLSMPAAQSQKARECHLLALQMLNRPTTWSRQPTTLSTGTTRVSGMEKEDKMEVTVEMQMELQAPPEQMVRGIDRLDRMLRSSSFTTGGCCYCDGRISDKNEQASKAITSTSKQRRCLTSHFPSSKPPCMPPSFLTALARVRQNTISSTPTRMYLARLSPVCCLQAWYFWQAMTSSEGHSAQMNGKVSYSLMQAQQSSRVRLCVRTGTGPRGYFIANLYKCLCVQGRRGMRKNIINITSLSPSDSTGSRACRQCPAAPCPCHSSRCRCPRTSRSRWTSCCPCPRPPRPGRSAGTRSGPPAAPFRMQACRRAGPPTSGPHRPGTAGATGTVRPGLLS